MSIFRRSRRGRQAGKDDPTEISGGDAGAAAEPISGVAAEPIRGAAAEPILIVGLGNPGKRYAATRHNVGAMVVGELVRRWELPRPREKFKGLLSEGRVRPGGPRVATLLPQTYMNESGRSAGPARGALRIPLERIVAVYDEIDLPFGEVRTKQGGGTAGHNGIKSLRDGLGGADFWRVRVGVGRPDSTDPEVVAAYVLGRFREPDPEVRELVDAAAVETERLVERMAAPPE